MSDFLIFSRKFNLIRGRTKKIVEHGTNVYLFKDVKLHRETVIMLNDIIE